MKSDIPEDKLSEMRKQAYLDAYNAKRSNLDKHRNFADPILQGNDYYKVPEYKSHIESKNYYSNISSKTENFQEKPKIKKLPNKDNLDKKLIDKNPLPPNKTQSQITIDYEKRLHEEPKERKAITRKVESDNVFNFEPLKEKGHLKKFEGEFPSNFYTRESNRKTNYVESYLPSKIYNNEGRKDNIKEVIENEDLNEVGRRRRKEVKKTEVEEIFERGKNYLPVRYEEPTPIPGKGDFNALKEVAISNVPNIRKNGRKYMGKDFDYDS